MIVPAAAILCYVMLFVLFLGAKHWRIIVTIRIFV